MKNNLILSVFLGGFLLVPLECIATDSGNTPMVSWELKRAPQTKVQRGSAVSVLEDMAPLRAFTPLPQFQVEEQPILARPIMAPLLVQPVIARPLDGSHRESFGMLDFNRDGKISPEEGPEKYHWAIGFFELIDTDNDGGISYEEFVQWPHSPKPHS